MSKETWNSPLTSSPPYVTKGNNLLKGTRRRGKSLERSSRLVRQECSALQQRRPHYTICILELDEAQWRWHQLPGRLEKNSREDLALENSRPMRLRRCRQFGSVWLVCGENGKLEISTTPKAKTRWFWRPRSSASTSEHSYTSIIARRPDYLRRGSIIW